MPDSAVPAPPQTVAELRRELDKARAGLATRDSAYSERIAYQAATNDVLKVMSNSPGDPQPVFDLIATRARDLCDAYGVTVYEFDGELVHYRVATGVSDDPEVRKAFTAKYPMPPTRDMFPHRAMLDRELIRIDDLKSEPGLNPIYQTFAVRSAVAVPLIRGDVAIGALGMGSRERGGFTDSQIELLKTFASQAVIAIENARLFNETQLALERQTATADILKVIASSPNDVQPVFEAIAERSNRLISGFSTAVFRFIKGAVHLVAITSVSPDGDKAVRASYPRPIGDYFAAPHAGKVLAVADTEDYPDARLKDVGRIRGFRSIVYVPLMSSGSSIGAIGVGRKAAGPFSSHHIALLQTFADQAVIAIENVGLFEEVKARSRDLQESLQQQTATADVLKVISRSAFDLQAVLQTLVESAARLCGADKAQVLRPSDNQRFYAAASHGHTPEYNEYLSTLTFAPGREGVVGRVLLQGEPVQIADVLTDPDYRLMETQRLGGFRTHLGVPLLREGNPIGILIVSRVTVRPFDDKQIELLTTFADQAVIAIENARLFEEVQARTRDLQESLQQQTATSEVLEIISSSPDELGPVFEKMLENATRVCGAEFGSMNLVEGDTMRRAALYNAPPEFAAVLTDRVFQIHPQSSIVTSVRTKQIVQVEDLRESSAYLARARAAVELADLGGARTLVVVPMLRDGEAIGVITVYRQEVRPFSDKQIELLTNFARQAVIAIENARLLRELRQRTDDLSESLQQQTATSEVLQIISSSPGELSPVFDKMLENATRVCGAEFGSMILVDGDMFRQAALYNAPPAFAAIRSNKIFVPNSQSITATAIRTRKVVHLADARDSPAYLDRVQPTVEVIELGGARTMAVVPMLREDDAIGVITVYRQEVRPFGDKQIELLTNFARQAVIAIENARLLRELRQRTDDLTEALVYQTGSGNILKVIASSPTDVEPALKAIVESAREICAAYDAAVVLKDGEDLVVSAHHGPIPPGFARQPISRTWITGRAVLDKVPQHVHDLLGPEGDDFPDARVMGRRVGYRTVLSVPLLREGEAIGAIALRRVEVQPFSNKQIEVLKSFADQAVIAISNVRLFDEVQAKTRDLEESLQQQTATSEVLQVISSSQGELGPVFDKMLENAARVCGANFGTMNLWSESGFNHVAGYNVPPQLAALRQAALLMQPHPESGHAAVVRTHRPAHFDDLSKSPAYFAGAKHVVEMVDVGGARSMLVVPLLKEDELIGAMAIYRQEIRPFADKQIALVENFTKQAVIAIENARLLRELHQRTDDLSESLEQQTATSEVLQVISSSSGKLEPVFNKMLENATGVCGAEFGTMTLYEDGSFRTVALHNAPKAYADTQLYKIIRPHPESGLSAVQKTHQPIQIPDIRNEPPYLEGNANVRALADLGGARTLVTVPMLKEDQLVGSITIYRQEVKPFTEKQTELVANFANQAVIAIENARLLNELRERTEELSRSLDDLRAAQDRLVQTEKLASLGQLTAGIAHEIKNPLNFVNNFSQLSAELVDEMTDVFQNTALDEASRRKELDEIRELLKGNLEKVVQHGKRADSIVKNMLLHSREGSGELRSADINGLVEESLNLAYHGARAEKSGFNITLQRKFDASAGAAELFPQEITRALLNLISNGFYAATKRKTENGEAGFEPTLSATTRNLGASVEIRIRDNGTGIPPEVKEKIFNPFFTTKPAGEGTGLGLSMTHDIIVKQHGGTITVDTEPGVYTEFILTLPRATGAQNIQRSTN